jgi:hypothetical protein
MSHRQYIGSGSGLGIRIRIQLEKNDPQKISEKISCFDDDLFEGPQATSVA